MIRFPSGVALLLAGSLALAGESEPIRIAGPAWVGDVPTKVADQLGYFNLELTANETIIEVLDYGSGLKAMRSLVEGHSQFALEPKPRP